MISVYILLYMKEFQKIIEPIKYVFVFVCVMAVAGWIVPKLLCLLPGGVDGGMSKVATSAVYSVVLFVLFYRLRWCPLSSGYALGRHWDVIAWTVLFSLGSMIPEMALELLMPDLPNLVAEQMMQVINSDFGYVSICLFAPLVEEIVFRGAVLRQLLQEMPGRQWLAIVISALLFSIVHMNPAQMPFAFVAGIFLGWIYSRTGSIVPGVLYHWVNNSVVFLLARMMPQLADGDITMLFGGDHRRTGLAVIFSLFIMLPSLYQLVIRTRK